MRSPPFGHAGMCFLRGRSRGITAMTIDIPAEGALARFVVIGGGVGGVALMAAAVRTVLHVAKATSTVMAWRAGRTGTVMMWRVWRTGTVMAWMAGRTGTVTVWRVRRTGTVTLRWVIMMRTSGCGALGAIASLGLITLQYYQYKVNDGMGVYLSGTATCRVCRWLHLLIQKAQQPQRSNKNITSVWCFAKILLLPESSDSVRSSHVFTFLWPWAFGHKTWLIKISDLWTTFVRKRMHSTSWVFQQPNTNMDLFQKGRQCCHKMCHQPWTTNWGCSGGITSARRQIA